MQLQLMVSLETAWSRAVCAQLSEQIVPELRVDMSGVILI